MTDGVMDTCWQEGVMRIGTQLFGFKLFSFFVWLICSGYVSGATTGDVLWSGGAGEANPYWNIDANWTGGEAPANPTSAKVTFTTNDTPVLSVLETDREIGSLASGMTESTNNRTTLLDLNGYTLVINNLLGAFSGYRYKRNTFVLTNGTVQVGTDLSAANLTIGAGATLQFAPGTILNATNIDTLTIGVSGYIDSILDLRGARIAGGELNLSKLDIRAASWRAGRLYVSSDTELNKIHVAGATLLGIGLSTSGHQLYFGDPDDPFTFEGLNYGYFPAGIELI